MSKSDIEGKLVKRYSVELLKKSAGQWFDLGLKRVLEGEVYAYRINDTISGEWLLNLKISTQVGKAIVEAVTSERTSVLHDQIKRKSITFNACKDRRYLYHPLGIGLVEKGRFTYNRVNEFAEVPQEIKDKFTLKLYEEVSPTEPSSSLKGKIVAVIKREHLQQMVLLFFLEKILPVFPSPSEAG